MRALVIAVGLWLVIAPVHAQDAESGIFWYPLCREDHDLCIGFLKGVGQAHEALVFLGMPRRYCLPRGITTTRIRELVMSVGEEDPPARLKMRFALLVMATLERHFPCPKGK